MFVKLLKLTVNYILNNGVKKSDVTDLTFDVKGSNGTHTFGVNATITIETKQTLTPKESRRKNLIILLVISIVFMIGLSTIGLLLPDTDAGSGRTLVLLSEIPAFAFSLVSTRFLMRRKRGLQLHKKC